MSTLAVKVKWVKEKYDVEVMLDEPVEVFKAQVCLTSVIASWGSKGAAFKREAAARARYLFVKLLHHTI